MGIYATKASYIGATWCLAMGGWLKVTEHRERVVDKVGCSLAFGLRAVSSLPSLCALNASWAWRAVEIACQICYIM